jgi:hypothetical protein
MSIEQEINRLRELMPASGRMFCQIVSKPQQLLVISAPFPVPWKQGNRHIYINFDLWRRLSRPQRDLLFLSSLSNLIQIKWFNLDVYQGITLAGILGLTVEAIQGDLIGMIVAGSLTAIASSQIWRQNRTLMKELEADEGAIRIALRRGYGEIEAAKYLIEAIERLPSLENRSSLDFRELIRVQNLRSIANLSQVATPSVIE